MRLHRSILALAAAVVLGSCPTRDSSDRDAERAVASPALEAQIAAGKAPRRILFFTVDALAANHLSTYGYERTTSPELTRFAAEAVLFENAVAPAPWTYPSYAAQLTSRHSLTTMGFKGWRIPESETTIAEYLQDAGYVTAGFVDNHYLYRKFGMAQGFDHYEEYNKSNRKSLHRALDWVKRHPRDPFFLFVHTNDVHSPYIPSEPWTRMFDHDEHWGEPHRLEVLRHRQPHVFGALPRVVYRKGRRDVNYYEARYDAAIRQTDFEFGRLVELLESLGDWDDTVVIFSSDHGESMGNHDFYFNHGLLYEDIIRVPLLIKFPGGRFDGRRIATQVSLLDLLPTVLEMLNLPARNRIAGKSLFPLVRGERAVQHGAIFASEGIFEQYMIRTDQWKLLKLIPGTDEQPSKQAWRSFPGVDLERPDKVYWQLYDLVDDPDERHDVIDEHPAIARSLKAKLEDWIARPEDYKSESIELGDEDRERLRALGYVE